MATVLEAFRHKPNDVSFAPLTFQLRANTNYPPGSFGNRVGHLAFGLSLSAPGIRFTPIPIIAYEVSPQPMPANPLHACYLSRPKDVPGFPHVFTIGAYQLASVRRFAVKRRARYRDFPPDGSGFRSRSRSLPGL